MDNINIADIITVCLSAIAIIVSIIALVLSYKQSKYEFASIEATKSDFLRLISALKSVVRKSTYSHLVTKKIDIEDELTTIKNFLTSDTWLVSQHIIDDEILTMLYSQIMILQYSEVNIKELGYVSAKTLENVAKISRNYIGDIAELKKKYSTNIADYTVLDSVTSNFYSNYEKNTSIQDQKTLDRLRKIQTYLHMNGTSDPDVDLFIIVLSNSYSDSDKIQGKPSLNVTLQDVLARYEYLDSSPNSAHTPHSATTGSA